MNRRTFLQSSAAVATVGALTKTTLSAPSPNDKITVCVAGVRGRGGSLLETFAAIPEVTVKYVCDLDPQVLASRVAQIESKTGRKPEGIKDFRAALDDTSVDALVLGTPDHWHALPTIHACQAGKDVYVEKPDGHNILEGLTMVAAAKKHSRIIQLGTQARSDVGMHACVSWLKEGHLGKVRFAKGWESSKQGSIGHVPDSEPPKGFDYNTWLGPAPLRPFNARRFHGNWRWFFDYGTGDLGNDGVHRLDVARWALESAIAGEGKPVPGLPAQVSALGGKYYFDDDQEWPDTLMVTFSYPAGYLLSYEMRIWTPYPLHEEGEGALVYGDNGFVVIGNSRWRAFDAKGKLVREEKRPTPDTPHAKNFLDCMRSRKAPAADLETVGQPSSLLCHLGMPPGVLDGPWSSIHRPERSRTTLMPTSTSPGQSTASPGCCRKSRTYKVRRFIRQSRINHLFPPDQIHNLPTWRFVLHFTVPPNFDQAMLRRAGEQFKAVEWTIVTFPFGFDSLEYNDSSQAVGVGIEVTEDRRRQLNSLADYESDVWKIIDNMLDCGFEDIYYEAVDWEE